MSPQVSHLLPGYLLLVMIPCSAIAEGNQRDDPPRSWDLGNIGQGLTVEGEMLKASTHAKRVATAAEPARKRLQAAIGDGLSITVPAEVKTAIEQAALKIEPARREQFKSDRRVEWFFEARTDQLEGALQGNRKGGVKGRDHAFDLHQLLTASLRTEAAEKKHARYQVVKPYLDQLKERAEKLTAKAMSPGGARVLDASKLYPMRHAWEQLMKESGRDGIWHNLRMEKTALTMYAVADVAIKKNKPTYTLPKSLARPKVPAFVRADPFASLQPKAKAGGQLPRSMRGQ